MLEDQIAALTAALKENTTALLGSAAKASTKTKVKPDAPVAPPASTTTALIDTRTTKTEGDTPESTETAASADETPAIGLPELRSVTQQILDSGPTGLEQVRQKVFGPLGIKGCSSCPPEKFVELHTALVALKAELDTSKTA